MPLLLGLTKIMSRQLSYLLNESNSTLESLKNPFSDEVEGVQDRSGAKKPNATKRNRDLNFPAAGVLPKAKNFIDLTNVKYPGLDNQVLKQL